MWSKAVLTCSAVVEYLKKAAHCTRWGLSNLRDHTVLPVEAPQLVLDVAHKS